MREARRHLPSTHPPIPGRRNATHGFGRFRAGRPFAESRGQSLPPDHAKKQSAPRREPRSRRPNADSGRRKLELFQLQFTTLPAVTRSGSRKNPTTLLAVVGLMGIQQGHLLPNKYATSFAPQFFTVMVSESTAFLPVTPSSPANKPR
jgi:hypothetical protein